MQSVSDDQGLLANEAPDTGRRGDIEEVGSPFGSDGFAKSAMIEEWPSDVAGSVHTCSGEAKPNGELDADGTTDKPGLFISYSLSEIDSNSRAMESEELEEMGVRSKWDVLRKSCIFSIH